MAITLSGEAGFAGLREALHGVRPADTFICGNIPYERLRRALLDAELTVADKLVRLRHALRYASIHSPESGVGRSLPVDRLFPNGLPEELSAYGLVRRAGGWTEALPWRPEWLLSADTDGVDAFAMGEFDRPWRKTGINADPWIKHHFGLETYRGMGQASAVRSALHMPSGRTLIVLLPTGEGKSLIFQALAVCNPGKTVLVIVPTVALAQDHAASAKLVANLGNHEFAYLGGNEEANALIRGRMLDGTQRLVFAAPEASVTSLRGSIVEAARIGKLTAVVVDEAHIVDAWGTDFRCEFQMLSALATQVKREAPENAKPNILCLSATVTPMSYETLCALFSSEVLPGIAGAPRLRPEPDIWIDREWVDIRTRQERVIEAIRHLPRPAILYVTLPSDAEDWYFRLRNIGFGRVARVHGRTSTAEKDRVVKQWRSGELDLVVGNSAFGLGIDFPNVRSVIHACLPESIDRYYQEIGRAGRDNRSCIALLIPSFQDKSVAKAQSESILISVKKGVARWNSMFERKVRPDPAISRYIVDLETAPVYDPDMRSGRNEDWNAQALNLMARSGLIQLTGLPSDADRKHTIAIDIKDDGHASVETWNHRVQPLRRRIQENNQRGFSRMLELVDSKKCPRTIFSDTYQLDPVGTSVAVTEGCGGCEVCRRRTPGWFANWPGPPHPPWPVGGFDAPRFNFLDVGLVFVERSAAPESRTAQRHMRELVDALWNAGWRKCIIVGQAESGFMKKLASQPWCVAQGGGALILASNGLPDGPELVWLERPEDLNARYVDQSLAGNERIYLVPNGCADPRNPGSALAERKAVRQVTEILNRIGQ